MSVAALAPAAGERPRTTTLFDALEIAAVLLVLFWLTEAWATVLVGNDPAAPVDNDQLRRFWLPTYGLMLVLAASRPRSTGRCGWAWRLACRSWRWPFASTQWSIAPDVTLRRSITLALTTFFGFYLAARFSWRTLIEMAAAALVIVAAGSLVAAVAFPELRGEPHHPPGRLAGAVQREEHAGSRHGPRGPGGGLRRRARARAALAWAGRSAALRLMTIASTSTTALLGLLVVMASFPCGAALRSRGAAAVAAVWLAFAAVFVGLGVFIFAPEIFFDAVGKDATLTGADGDLGAGGPEDPRASDARLRLRRLLGGQGLRVPRRPSASSWTGASPPPTTAGSRPCCSSAWSGLVLVASTSA
jgi:hypothetical protein